MSGRIWLRPFSNANCSRASSRLHPCAYALLRGDVFLIPLIELKDFQNSDFTVVLQKLVEDRKRLEKGSCLCNYSKDLVDEEDLSLNTLYRFFPAFGDPLAR